jgi:hypothetical protein
MDREAIEEAIEVLEDASAEMLMETGDKNYYVEAIAVLRQALETEPFEYWNAVEGWVKIDEVREHFDAVGCGTIYKSAGEGRSPLYTAPPKQWVGLTEREVELIDEMIETQLLHAERCDHMANSTMAQKQKAWDLERVELLRKLKEKNT